MTISKMVSILLLCLVLFPALPAKAATVTPGLTPEEMAHIMHEHKRQIEEWYHEEEDKEFNRPSREDIESGKATPYDPELIEALRKALLSQILWTQRFCRLYPGVCSDYKNKP